ncbi:MarR family transcriptional regulator [bacterium]|nr:MarR family transcriptional regulator [bacterium]MCB2179307.1 MarR family transcriptional regulator [bacterium]
MVEKNEQVNYELQMVDLMHRMQKLRLGDFPKGHFNLSYPQMALILFVNNNPGKHLQEVADGMELTAPTVSVSIRRMEEDGWIERRPDPEDGRATCIFLTEKSDQIIRKLTAAQLKSVRLFLRHLSEEEQKKLLELMRKAISGVEKQSNTSINAA